MSAGHVADYGMIVFWSGARPQPGGVALVACGMSDAVQQQFRRMESPNLTISPRGLELWTFGSTDTTAEPIVRTGEVLAQAPGEKASGATDGPEGSTRVCSSTPCATDR